MSLNGTFTYDKYGEVATPLSVTNAAAFGSTAMTFNLDIGANHGVLVTDTTGNTVGVYTPAVGRLHVTGNAVQISSTLASLRYVGDVSGYFSNVVGTAQLLYAGNSVVAQSGTLNLTANVPVYPTYNWSNTPTTANTQKLYTAGSQSVSAKFPTVVTTQPYSVIKITNSGVVAGNIAPVQSELFDASKIGKGAELYATTEAINTYLTDITYIPAVDDVYAKFNIQVFSGVLDSPSANSTVEFYTSGRLSFQTVNGTEDSSFLVSGGVTANIPVNIAATYVTTYTVNTTKIATLNGNTVGNAVVSWSANTGVLTISGGDATNTLAAMNTIVATPVANIDTDQLIAVTMTSSIGMNQTGNIPIHISGVNDPPSVSGLPATYNFREHDDPPGFLPAVVITELDTTETITATYVTSISQGNISSVNGGSWNAATRTWTMTANTATVNTALSSLKYFPTFLPAIQTNMNIVVTIRDAANTGPASSNITVICENAVTTASNMTLTKTWTEDTPFTDWAVRPSVTTIDGNAVTVSYTLSNAVVGSLASTSGGTWNANTGTWSITDTMSAVNTALGNITFTPTLNYDSSFTIAVTVRGNAVNDGPSGTITMTCVPVSDAPVVAPSIPGTTNYNQFANTVSIPFVVSDPDGSSWNVTANVVSSRMGLIQGNTGDISNSVSYTDNSVTNVNAWLGGLKFIPSVPAIMNKTSNATQIAYAPIMYSSNTNAIETPPIMLQPLSLGDIENSTINVTVVDSTSLSTTASKLLAPISLEPMARKIEITFLGEGSLGFANVNGVTNSYILNGGNEPSVPTFTNGLTSSQLVANTILNGSNYNSSTNNSINTNAVLANATTLTFANAAVNFLETNVLTSYDTAAKKRVYTLTTTNTPDINKALKNVTFWKKGYTHSFTASNGTVYNNVYNDYGFPSSVEIKSTNLTYGNTVTETLTIRDNSASSDYSLGYQNSGKYYFANCYSTPAGGDVIGSNTIVQTTTYPALTPTYLGLPSTSLRENADSGVYNSTERRLVYFKISVNDPLLTSTGSYDPILFDTAGVQTASTGAKFIANGTSDTFGLTKNYLTTNVLTANAGLTTTRANAIQFAQAVVSGMRFNPPTYTGFSASNMSNSGTQVLYFNKNSGGAVHWMSESNAGDPGDVARGVSDVRTNSPNNRQQSYFYYENPNLIQYPVIVTTGSTYSGSPAVAIEMVYSKGNGYLSSARKTVIMEPASPPLINFVMKLIYPAACGTIDTFYANASFTKAVATVGSTVTRTFTGSGTSNINHLNKIFRSLFYSPAVDYTANTTLNISISNGVTTLNGTYPIVWSGQ